jgi:hypothetical protein
MYVKGVMRFFLSSGSANDLFRLSVNGNDPIHKQIDAAGLFDTRFGFMIK